MLLKIAGCASNTEFRDLLSEYNLLKDVDHINVIKLLGACTQKGESLNALSVTIKENLIKYYNDDLFFAKIPV